MFNSIVVICIGGSCGSLLRWFLGMQFNSLFPNMPMGTLAANLVGGYVIGLALGFFNHHPMLSPEYKLLIITGFLGGLTTFSTFSLEVATSIQAGRMGWAMAILFVHVLGSVALTLLGLMTVEFIRT